MTSTRREAETQQFIDLHASPALTVAGVGAYVWDLESDTVVWNDALYEITGLDPALHDGTPETFGRLVHPDDYAGWSARRENLREGPTSFVAQCRIIRPDGGIRWIETRTSVDGGPGLVAGVMLDVTEKKTVELALASTNRRLEDSQRSALVGSWEYDPATATARATDTLREMFGFQIAGSVPSVEEWLAAVHPDDRDGLLAAIGALGDEGEFEHEFRVVVADAANDRVMHAWGRMEPGHVGRERRQMVTVQDVTELRRAEAAGELAQRSLELAGVGAWRLTLDDGRVWWSPEAYTVFGATRETFDGTLDAVEARMHPEDAAAWRRSVERRVQRRLGHDTTLRVVTDDGDVRWIDARGDVEADASGRVVAMTGVVADATARCAAEAQLVDINRRYAEAEAVARVCSWEWRPATGEIVWSDGLYDLVGRDRTRPPPDVDEFLAYIHPEDRARVATAVEDSMQTGLYEVEYRLLPDGGDEPVEVYARARFEFDAEGVPVRQLGTAVEVTDLRSAERAAATASRTFATLVDQAPVAIQVTDRAGRVIQHNEAFAAVFGLDSETIGSVLPDVSILETPGLADLQLPDLLRSAFRGEVVDVPRMRIDTERVLHAIGVSDVEVRSPWVEGRYFPVRDEDGEVRFVAAMFSDVTGEVENEQAREEMEGRLRSIFDNTASGLALTDLDGRMVEVNGRLSEIAGRPSSDLVGRRLNDLIVAEDRVEDSPEYVALLEGAQDSYRADRRLERPDGEIVWCNLTVAAVRTGQSTPDQLVVEVRDVTRTREDERRLEQAAEVFRSTAECVMILDERKHLLEVNRAFTEVTGHGRDQALGRHVGFLRSGRHSEDEYSAIWNAVEHTGHWRGQLTTRHADGRIVPALLTVSAVHGASGEPLGYVVVWRDITEMKASEERLDRLANRDPLTDLPNRRLLMARLEQSLRVARRRGTGIGLLFVDLDHFKAINDGFSHSFGDALLREVAHRLTMMVREEDTVARMGGDEFVIVLEDVAGPAATTTVMEKLRRTLADPIRVEGVEVRVSASVGISTSPEDGSDAESLLRSADTAMHRAKEAGRNRYEFYSPDMTRAAGDYVFMAGEIRRALEEGEFRLVYQPQFALDTGGIVGVEALARWSHPELGDLPPDRFIPVAEQSGLIRELGWWIIDEACRQGATWRDAGLDIGRIAVNIADQQIHHGDLESVVRRALDTSRLPADRLALEVTEGFVMQRPEDSVDVLGRLVDAGVEIAIDDFGTGYSSLSHLKLLPVQKLKIDRSFVDGLPDDPHDVAIVDAVLALARSLDLVVIAEGVETPAQERHLRLRGCGEAQGFHLSRPLEPGDLAARFQ